MENKSSASRPRFWRSISFAALTKDDIKRLQICAGSPRSLLFSVRGVNAHISRFMFFLTGILLAATSCFMTAPASAENGCPNGYAPWKIPVDSWSDCMPIPDYQSDAVERLQGPAWETNWGAVAIGGGGWGVSVNMRSEAQAKNAAVGQCRKTADKKNSKCATLTYYNQCIAIAWGTTGYAVHTAEDEQTAASLAMKQCKDDARENCKIFYSACSLPRPLN
jgi:Domain of unknown function (DUF4189)